MSWGDHDHDLISKRLGAEQRIKEENARKRKSIESIIGFNHLKFSGELRLKRSVDLRIDIREASIQIGISSSTLSRLENNKTPDVITFYKCCKWLDKKMDFFFTPLPEPTHH